MILILNDHQNIKISKSYTNDIVKSKKIPWQISILFIIYKWVHVNIFKIAENKLNTSYYFLILWESRWWQLIMARQK